jgi:hypothetical protein
MSGGVGGRGLATPSDPISGQKQLKFASFVANLFRPYSTFRKNREMVENPGFYPNPI